MANRRNGYFNNQRNAQDNILSAFRFVEKIIKKREVAELGLHYGLLGQNKLLRRYSN